MAGGDEDALSALYEATLGRVYGVALRILNNEAVAEEIVTDVYYEAWQNAAKYDSTRGRPITWLLTICHSRSLDEYRRRLSEQRIKDAAATLDVHDDVAEPDYLLEVVEQGHRLHGLISELSADQRQLLALSFFRGLTHRQISDYTSMPLGTVKSGIRRALTALGAQLPQEDQASA